MVQLCAAIWLNILKGWQRDAGASAGKGNQVITENQISEREDITTEFCFMFYCSLCAWDPVWHCRKARPCLTAMHSCAEPWLEGKASSSVLSVVWAPHTVAFPSLHTPSHPPSFYLSKFGFVISCHVCSPYVTVPGG